MAILADQLKHPSDNLVKPFDWHRHAWAIEEWVKAYNLNPSIMQEIPKIGFVAEDESGMIAAGFLRKIEKCNFALLDGLIANPESFGKRRYFALDLVVQRLIERAEQLGLQQLFAFSIDKGTLKRSIKHGFKALPHSLIALDLK